MGSFDFTCMASNLPISAGTPVRYLLLTENPFNSLANRGINQTDGWFPRAYPIRGRYNDYGTIDRWDPEDPMIDLLMTGFVQDLHERGWGDNSVHDMAIKKDMTFDYALDAIRAGRLTVNRFGYNPLKDIERSERLRVLLGEVKKTEDARAAEDLAAGLATPRAVELALTQAGYGCLTAPKNVDAKPAAVPKKRRQPIAVFVSGQTPGWVRVRLQDTHTKDHQKRLADIATLLQANFSAMVTTGTGHYAWGGEVQVMTSYSTEDKGQRRHATISRGDEKQKNTPLLCLPAMIREDVWQTLVNAKTQVWDSKAQKHRNVGIGQGAKSIPRIVKIMWEHNAMLEEKKKEEGKDFFPLMYSMGLEDKLRDEMLGWPLSKESVPGVYGLSQHFKLLVPRLARMSKELQARVLRDVAETLWVGYRLHEVRVSWSPSTSCGPQGGDYKAHADLLQGWADIAKKVHRNRNR